MQKKALLICFILLTASVFVSCIMYPSYEQMVERRGRIQSITFEREKWFDDEGIGKEALWEKRPRLARDLINRKLLIGKSYEEITKLLGKNYIDRETNSVSYEIYVDMGVVDPVFIENLLIYFDENNKVRSAKIKIKMMDGHPDYR